MTIMVVINIISISCANCFVCYYERTSLAVLQSYAMARIRAGSSFTKLNSALFE